MVYPRPKGDPDARQYFYLDAMSKSTNGDEITAIAETAKGDPDFGEGTEGRKAIKTGFLASMKRVVPGWTPQKTAAGTKKKADAAKGGGASDDAGTPATH